MDLDELLRRHEEAGGELERTWTELVTCAAGLGAALARFDDACNAYGAARRAEGLPVGREATGRGN